MGQLPDKSKPCTWGQRCLPLLMLKCYCTIYKANALRSHNGISPYVRTSPEDTFVAGTFKHISCWFWSGGYVCSSFLGRNLLWFELITGSYLYLFTVASNSSRTLFSPFSFSVTLQLKHWWGRSWNLLGAEEPLAHSHTSFSLPYRRSIVRPVSLFQGNITQRQDILLPFLGVTFIDNISSQFIPVNMELVETVDCVV